MRNLYGVRLDESVADEEERFGRYELNVQKEDDGFVRLELSNRLNGIYMELNAADANWLGFELARLSLDECEKMTHRKKEES